MLKLKTTVVCTIENDEIPCGAYQYAKPTYKGYRISTKLDQYRFKTFETSSDVLGFSTDITMYRFDNAKSYLDPALTECNLYNFVFKNNEDRVAFFNRFCLICANEGLRVGGDHKQFTFWKDTHFFESGLFKYATKNQRVSRDNSHRAKIHISIEMNTNSDDLIDIDYLCDQLGEGLIRFHEYPQNDSILFETRYTDSVLAFYRLMVAGGFNPEVSFIPSTEGTLDELLIPLLVEYQVWSAE